MGAELELNTQFKYQNAIDPAAIFAGNTTKTGNTIDRQGFKALEFVIISGVLTDAVYTTTLEEGDQANMSDAATVADKDMIPNVGGTTQASFALTDDSVCKKVGYKGNKRYVRVKVVQSGATTGGYLCAIAVQGEPDYVPATGIP